MQITANGSKGHGHKFTLTVNETSTDVINNTSEVSINLQLSGAATTWPWTGHTVNYSVTVNGVTTAGSFNKYGTNKGTVYSPSPLTLVNKTQTVEHNNDGTKELEISFRITDNSGASYVCGNASASGVVELTVIPRASTFTLSPNDVLSKGSKIIVDVDKKLDSAIDSLIGTCNGYTAFSTTYSNPGNWSFETNYEAIVSTCHLEANRTYDLEISLTTTLNGIEVGTNTFNLKISTGTMPLSVIYKDGRYGISFGKKASEVEKLKSEYPLEIGDSTTDLSLKLNGRDVYESGTEGSWQYIKLGCGIAIIWAQVRHNGISYPNTWDDNVYTNEQQMPIKPSWFTQINITASSVSDSMSAVLGELQLRGAGTSYVFIRPNTVSGGGKGYAHFQAIGTWQ